MGRIHLRRFDSFLRITEFPPFEGGFSVCYDAEFVSEPLRLSIPTAYAGIRVVACLAHGRFYAFVKLRRWTLTSARGCGRRTCMELLDNRPGMW